MAGMRPLRSAVSRNSCDASTPNSCVGRRISTSTMSGLPLVEASSRRVTMGCRCSANSSSRSAESMSPSRCSSRASVARSCASDRRARQVARSCSAAMIVVSGVSVRDAGGHHDSVRIAGRAGGWPSPAPAAPARAPSTRVARSSSQVVRPENAISTTPRNAHPRTWQAHNVRGRYPRSPTTGRSFARARHADLRSTSAISA